jgi:hypothetical protein
MAQMNNSNLQSFNRALLIRQILIGAGIALLLITLLLFQVKVSDPAWGEYWMVRPLIVVPFAGALGGLIYYSINNWFHFAGLRKILIIILSLIIYMIVLWLGTILGLDGTLWD